MLRIIDDQLHKLTMYKTIVYSLLLLFVAVIVFSLTGNLDYSVWHLIGSLVVIMAAGFVTNQVLAKAWNIPVNADSGLITSLIIFFLISPELSPEKIAALAVASVAAQASKFFITYHGKHIFNPAAFGVFIVGTLGIGSSAWWVGSEVLWPFVLVFGLLVARKIRRMRMVLAFIAASVMGVLFVSVTQDVPLNEILGLLLFASPLLFLGFYMLTEPSTMPASQRQRMIFAIVVGLLFATRMDLGGIYINPETALLLGNMYAFAVSPKRRHTLDLLKKRYVTGELYDYEFKADVPLKFVPGQYFELTLPMNLKSLDDRGNRRTFTIASSPTEDTVRVGIRQPAKNSAFKKALDQLRTGDLVYAGQIAGDFVLPRDASEKLLFVAGGIGITPFRSMIKYVIDTKQSRDIVLLYGVRNKGEVLYKDIFDEAAASGLKTHVIVGQPIDAATLSLIEDVRQRTVYISGTPPMVRDIKRIVIDKGVRRQSIKTDYFSGY